ncbi:hypothetical protein [Pediococcus pentosaceus]|uniref:hypothetical protein n=1 Tax=Pediococcus pentosaceus TaxID=1255 RepID=UPI00223ACDDC|nr:hypothetical protein [Pediococcus pentosaceus]MCS8573777.1 hypothetical protein [Pediococcus pentosaceus]
MNNEVFKYYVDEINLLTNFVKIAAEHFNKIINEKDADNNLVWYDLQNIIIYSADVSKILWGSKGSTKFDKKYHLYRSEFRKLLEVEDDWEIGPDNKILRNKLEHIDENIVKFTSKNHIIVYDRNIVSIYNMASINGIMFNPNKEMTLRSYNVDLGEYIFFGRAFNVKKACEECRRLRLKTDELIKNEVSYEDLVSDD